LIDLAVDAMVSNPIRWTVRDLTVMPDDGGWKRYEAVDGELFVTRAPHFCHQRACGNPHFELRAGHIGQGLVKL
jgi:hypothetical protein